MSREKYVKSRGRKPRMQIPYSLRCISMKYIFWLNNNELMCMTVCTQD